MGATVIIDDILPWTQYIATAGQTVFDATWTADVATDIVVFARADGINADDATQLVSDVDYTVTFVGSNRLVRITFAAGRTLDDIVTVTRLTPAQRMNLYNNTNFTPTMLNGDFGRVILMIQQNQFYWEQNIPRYNTSETLVQNVDTKLPLLGANQIWAKNPDNDAIIPYDVPASGGVAPKTATYLTQTLQPNNELPNAQVMGELATGFVQNTTSTGVQTTRVLTGTANQINIDNGNGATGNPTWTVSSTLNLPGTFTIQGSTVVNEIINDATMATAGTDNLSTSTAIKNYVDNEVVGSVTSITGTANQVIASAATGAVTLSTPQDIATTSSPSFAGATFTDAVDMSSQLINNVLDPVDLQDAATKNYVNAKTPTLADGELYIGVTGDDPVANTLTAGSGISIAEGVGTITISGIASSIGWTEVTGTTQAMAADQGYITNNAGLITLTLPTDAAVGTLLQVVGKGAGGWIIEQNAGQQLHVGNASTTAGVGGSIASTHARDAIAFVATTAHNEWTAQNIQGILTIE